VPEISSVSVLPAAPTAPGAAIAVNGPPAAPDVADNVFLSQFLSAVKSLASAALPHVVTQVVGASVAQPAVAADAAPIDAPLTDAPPTDDTQTDLTPAMLAALGFIALPPLVVNVPPPAEHASQTAPIASAAGSMSAPTEPQAQAVVSQPVPLGHLEVPLPAPAELAPAAGTVNAPNRPARTETPTTILSQLTPVDPSLTTLAPRPVITQDSRPTSAQAPATVVADSSTPIVATQPGASFQHSGADGDARDADSTRAESVSGAGPAQAVADGSFAVATTSALHTGPSLPAEIRPAEVVNQIAHQADLYRLPGSRAVRIQLHPEDLGGVDVTLRYSAAGGVQLHINVEHASTGALVQSGWTDLRDALATRGISPDRLVMSVTGPSNSSGLDSSNGNGSNRSDAGPASFTQGQGSPQHQAGQDQRTSTQRGSTWSGATDPNPSSVDESPRVPPATSARIDYRV
jgi:flagellar hook-length control protein FliK